MLRTAENCSMPTRPAWLIPALLAGVAFIMGETAQAQAQADLDAATLAANIAEQQKKAAEAKKATAVAQAEAAAASAKAANDLAKGKADSDKAKSDADKARADAEKAGADAAKAAADADKAKAEADKAKAEAATAGVKAANDVAKGKAESDKAKADSDKAKADADKAQVEAVKAGLPTPPDPTKYKIDKPAAPALNATIARLTFTQANQLANGFADSIARSIAPFVNDKPDPVALAKVALLADDAKARTLLAVADATKEGLLSVDARLKASTNELKGKKANQPFPAFAPGALLTIGSLLENVLAYATILRTQYAFTSVSTVTAAEAALQAVVQGRLTGMNLKVVDTDALLPLAANSSELAGGLKNLRGSISSARKEATDSGNWVKDRRETVPVGETEAAKKSRLKSADDVERLAEALGKIADDADKFVAALFVVDTQGNTPFNASQRGEALAGTLNKSDRTLTLTVKVITSDADTAATDGIFAGFKVYAGNATVARWKLVDRDGVVVGAGADMLSSAPTRIALTGN